MNDRAAVKSEALELLKIVLPHMQEEVCSILECYESNGRIELQFSEYILTWV